jgi:hypothetical protein
MATLHSPDLERERETAIDAVVKRLADALDPDALGAEIGDLIFEHVEEFVERGDDDLRRNSAAVAIGSLRDVWQGLRTSACEEDFDPPVAAIAWSAELVHRGVPLHALLRAYRIGHNLVERAWAKTADQLELEGELRARALERASRFFFSYVDEVSVQLTHIYLEERARWVRGSAAVRAEMARALLAGERVPAAKATSALLYDVTATHLGFVVWMEPSEPDDECAAALEAVAGRIAGALGGSGSMLIPVGNWLVWGWTHQRIAAGEPSALSLPAGIHVAIGSPAAGIEGLVQTHEEAVEARRVARLLGDRAQRAVFHHDVVLLELLTASPLAARRFVKAELGALAAADEHTARLRSTLHAYFDENMSPVRTARRLGVNKNTIVYRIGKVEEILGYPVPERRRELEAAVQLCEICDSLAKS